MEAKSKIEIGVVTNIPGRWVDVRFTTKSLTGFLAESALRVEALRFMAWAEENDGLRFDFPQIRISTTATAPGETYELARLDLRPEQSVDRGMALAMKAVREYAAYKVEAFSEGPALWVLRNLLHAFDLDDLSMLSDEQRAGLSAARALDDSIRSKARKGVRS